MTEAEAAYAARGYDAAGIAKAEEAVSLYQDAALVATGVELTKAQAGVARASSFYGSTLPDTNPTEHDAKVAAHELGYSIAELAVKANGVADIKAVSATEMTALKALPADQLQAVGEALYYYGANLGQWGKLNGLEALKRWPELAQTMKDVIALGFKSIHEYGPLRILGFGNYNTKKFGGSLIEAEKFLSAAVKATAIAGTSVSAFGYNNLYLALVLHDRGVDETDATKLQEAKDLLTAFIAADGKASGVAYLAEFVQSQKEAAGVLAKW